MWKKKMITAICLLLCVVCSTGCYIKTKRWVIREFEENREAFETVAAYIESFDWERWMGDGTTRFFLFYRTDIPRVEGAFEEAVVPEYTETVKKAAAQLYSLDFIEFGRYYCSGKTIVFHLEGGYELPLKPYREQGIAYAIDGSDPKPLYQSELIIDDITPLGGNWYYWHGVSYPGHVDDPEKIIRFDN